MTTFAGRRSSALRDLPTRRRLPVHTLLALVVLAIVCAFAWRGGAATLTPTPATFATMPGKALGGDVVALQPGTYKAKITGWKADPPVTLQCGPGVVFSGFSSFTDVRGLDFKDCAFEETAGTTALQLTRATNVTLSGGSIHGVMKGVGLSVLDSTGVTIDGVEFSHLGAGVSAVRNADLTLTRNAFHDIQSDAVQVVDHGDGLVFSRNRGWDFRPAAGDHPDFLQVRLSSAATRPTTNVTIEFNDYSRGVGGIVQGLFITALPALPLQGLVIRGNALQGTMYHGILAASAVDPLIEDNLVVGFKDMTSWIGVRNTGAVTGGRVRGNVATSFNNFASVGVVSGGNTVTPQADAPAAELVRAAWAKRHDPPVDPRDVAIAALTAQLAAANDNMAGLKAEAEAAKAREAALQAERDALAAKVKAALADLAA